MSDAKGRPRGRPFSFGRGGGARRRSALGRSGQRQPFASSSPDAAVEPRQEEPPMTLAAATPSHALLSPRRFAGALATLAALTLTANAYAADVDHGETLAKRWCAACHVVAPDQTHGQDNVPPFADDRQDSRLRRQRDRALPDEPAPEDAGHAAVARRGGRSRRLYCPSGQVAARSGDGAAVPAGWGFDASAACEAPSQVSCASDHDYRMGVARQRRVGRQQAQRLVQRLRDQHSVEWIGM